MLENFHKRKIWPSIMQNGLKFNRRTGIQKKKSQKKSTNSKRRGNPPSIEYMELELKKLSGHLGALSS